jgi:hypothetical protein
MPAWTEDELTRVDASQELEIAPVRAGGVEKDVAVEPADESVYDDVDAAYRSKYGRYASIVDGITKDEARSTTLRLVPRAIAG